MTQQDVSRLEEFDARLVQAPLQGLLRNMDCELVRRLCGGSRRRVQAAISGDAGLGLSYGRPTAESRCKRHNGTLGFGGHVAGI